MKLSIKIILILSCCLITYKELFAQTYKSFEDDKLEKVKLYKVKSITFYRSDKGDTSELKPVEKILTEEYDEAGNNTKTTTYYDNEKILSEKTCIVKKGIINHCTDNQYDEKGKISLVTESTFDDRGSPVKIISYEEESPVKSVVFSYDKNHNLVKKENLYNDTVVYILYLKYNDKNQRILDSGITSIRGSNGKRIYMHDRKNMLEYDKNGNVTRHLLYNDKNRLSTITRSTYDAKGNKTGVSVEMENGMVLVTQKMIYDKNNDLVEFINSYNDGKSSTIYKAYNDKGLLIKEESYHKGMVTEITEIKYTYY